MKKKILPQKVSCTEIFIFMYESIIFLNENEISCMKVRNSCYDFFMHETVRVGSLMGTRRQDSFRFNSMNRNKVCFEYAPRALKCRAHFG